MSAQQDLFQAETTWFHVFKSMIESGDLAKMGPYAYTVYSVIKSYTNFNTGQAFPSVETIAVKSSISEKQVKRSLVVLEDFGYITKKKVGRNNVYTLREKVEITDDKGRPSAVATWDYLPGAVKNAVADLKNVLMTGQLTGELSGAKIVQIERLQINVTHVHDNATNFNVQQFVADLDKLPKEMREKVMSAYRSSKHEVTDIEHGGEKTGV